jgi:hypothetical protein
MKYLFIFFFSLTLFAQQEITSCKCLEIDEDERFKNSEFIFHGKINIKTYKHPSRIYQVKIEQIYKGKTERTEFNIYSGSHNCGIKPDVGSRYVFYINKVIEGKKAYLNRCHKVYELTNKTINDEFYVELIAKSKSFISSQTTDKKVKTTKKFKTPTYQDIVDEEEKPGRFTDKIESKHTQEP